MLIARFAAAVVSTSMIIACSKPDAPAPPPSAQAAPQPAPSPSTATPTPTATATATEIPTPTAAVTPTPTPAHALAPPRASTAQGSRPACGDAPLAPCPLYAWMKTNAEPDFRDRDSAALASALERLAGLAPSGYANWKSIAKDGADAARVEDYSAVKAACRGCHGQYRERYRREMRDRPI